jgi:DNA-binding FadR family transcriptional regulator
LIFIPSYDIFLISGYTSLGNHIELQKGIQMDFTKLKAPTLKELFVREFETMILSGKLKIGEKLPPERILADQMQVSRAVVNSGIAELSRKGFLKVIPRSGVFVIDYRRYGTVETLLSIMNYNGGQLHRDEIRSILEIKMIVDKLAVELSVDRHADESIATLEHYFDKMMQSNENSEKAAAAAFSFYHELAMTSQNTLLPLIYRSFRVPVTHLWIRFIQKHGNEVICSSAQEILKALKNHDKTGAVATVEKAITASISGSKEIYEV